MSILPECVSVCHVPVWYLQMSEEGIRSSVTGGKDGCETHGLGTERWSSVSSELLSHRSSSIFLKIYLESAQF